MTASVSKSRIEEVFDILCRVARECEAAPTQDDIADMLACSGFTARLAIRRLYETNRVEREGDASYWRYHINGTDLKTAWSTSRHQAEGRTTRKCMCCKTNFQSQGNHNRICDGCKSANKDAASGFDNQHGGGYWNGTRMASV